MNVTQHQVLSIIQNGQWYHFPQYRRTSPGSTWQYYYRKSDRKTNSHETLWYATSDAAYLYISSIERKSR